MEGRTKDEAAGALTARDLLCLAALVAMCAWFIFDSTVLPPTLRQDNRRYIPMAEDPSAFFQADNVAAQRVLPSLLVWCGTRLLGLTVVEGFRILSGASYLAFLALFYVALRRGRAPTPIAFATTIFCGTCYWPMTYSLSNIYQACDAMAYPLALVMIALTIRRRTFALLAVSLLAAMTRQQLFVLACLCLFSLRVETNDRRALPCLLVILMFFGALISFTGEGGLAAHTVLRIFDLRAFARGFRETRFPVIFTPFLLLLMLCARETIGYVRKYWWVALFALVTMAQPLLAFGRTGPSNAQRLAMMGAWPAFWLAGLLLRDRLKSRWAMSIYVLLPLLYGTRHLTHLEHTYPSPVGHRSVMNVIIALLVLAEMCRRRLSTGVRR